MGVFRLTKRTITFFGSSIPGPGDKEYQDAYYIASNLAKRGFSICTGGYCGIMEAASKGAADNKAEAIGVTVDIFNAIPNVYLTKEIKCGSLYERINKLIAYGDAYIILTGGTGTLLELSSVWELMNKNILEIKPAACYGAIWKNLLLDMEAQIMREKRKSGLIKYFDNLDDLIKYISDAVK